MKMKNLVFLLFACVSLSSSAQRLNTTFSGDYSRWNWDGGSFQTVFSNDWDSWNYEGSKIKTDFSNDWDSWRVGNEITLKTVFANDFDGWEVRGYGKIIRVSSTFIDDLERWTISGDADGSMKTVFSNNFDSWNITLDEMNLEDDLKIGIVFIAVFTSFRQN